MTLKGIKKSVRLFVPWKILLEIRGGPKTPATSKMEHFEIIVKVWKPLTIITKSSISDVAEILDPPLEIKIRRKQKPDRLLSAFSAFLRSNIIYFIYANVI